MEKYESPLEKANQLKQQLEEEARQKAESEKQEKIQKLAQFLEEQRAVHTEKVEEVKELKIKRGESETNIQAAKQSREEIQKEGKEAGVVIQSAKEKLNYKEDASLQEIFSPIIAQLKEINEQVKIERQAKGEVSKELTEKARNESDRAWKTLSEFRNNHPELGALYEKAERLVEHKKYAIKNGEELAMLKDQCTPYLNHKAIFDDRLNRITDTTAKERMEVLDKEIERTSRLAQEETRKLDDEISKKSRKGKGFFDSDKSFRKKIEVLKEQREESSKEAWKPYTVAFEEKRKLENYIYELEKSSHRPIHDAFGKGGYGSEALKEFMMKNPDTTIGQVLEEARKLNDEYIESLQLNEEESLVKEINEVLKKNENEARYLA